ncbi:glycoside hydrolase family 5 protein [Moniliophthora roreri MCA 2997]|uniref:Glycoside hydrolase family 5 protein n=2 Tax=Moniliophthora roreri TaxID=221103 RepID=V2XLL4_MONRO|nr:glycoside hydrolase family 5 protein [Moniliophthora roreri MCA 2997]KAI3615040.1 glycoside hydrolase family 5 protein [Moniliophthora roreri]
MFFLPFGLLLCQALLSTAEQCQLRLNLNLNDPTIPTSTTIGNGSDNNSATASGTDRPPDSTPTRQPFDYGSEKIRGVNLGGWFVLEPWITPSIFENTNDDTIVDEYTLGLKRNNDETKKMLEDHWNTWITEDDFRQIAEAGLNHVRIPFGYWSVPMTSRDTNENTSPSPYIPGAWPYLLRALNWAAAHNVHVIIDIHGAPGSQNGYDNSGQRTDDPRWAYNPTNVSRTIDTIKYIAREAGGMIDILELLNESAGFRSSEWAAVTRQFWVDGYHAVREAAGDDLKIMIGDAFLGVNNWRNFLTYPDAQGVLMDFHQYQIFSNAELARSPEDHVQFACTMKDTISEYSATNLWTVMGEWSNAATDCTKWLNGFGRGARWDGTYQQADMRAFGSCDGYTGNMSGFSDEYKAFLRRYWEVQVEIGESAQGWVFWTWKAENSDDWSYQRGLEGGWIPKDPKNRMYPNICS